MGMIIAMLFLTLMVGSSFVLGSTLMSSEHSIVKQLAWAMAPAFLVGCFSWFMAMDRLHMSNGIQDVEIQSIKASVTILDGRYDNLNQTVTALVIEVKNLQEDTREIKRDIKEVLAEVRK